jgi:hypothetical protein
MKDCSLRAARDFNPMGDIPKRVLARYEALDALACRLFWELELLDPRGGIDDGEAGPRANWLALPEDERALYVTALQRALSHHEIAWAALKAAAQK